jgi:hypothetical protein
VILFAVVFLALCPLRWHVTTPGLDQSWAYALNVAHYRGMVFGRDLAFTYGAWAWIILPMAAGHSMAGALAAQSGMWLLGGLLLGWIVFRWEASLAGLALFAVMLTYGRPALFKFGYAGPDHFLVLLVLLSLGCVIMARRREPFMALAVAGSVLLTMIKISSAILALSVLATFCVFFWLAEHRRALPVVGMVAATPLLFVFAFLLHSASLANLASYLRTSLEIASAHSVAYSLPSDPADLHRAFVVLAAAAVLTAALGWLRQRSFWLAISLPGAWLLEFKHGFVRADGGHVGIFFAVAALLLGTVLLFSRMTGRNWWPVALVMVPLFWVYGPPPAWEFLKSSGGHLRDAWAATRPAELEASLGAASRAALAGDVLPAPLLAAIGREPVTVFPWELAYGAANAIDLRPMPALQGHNASTAYLDRWNASFFEDEARAPRFVIFEWQSIDYRHPLVDVPATTLSLWRWYDFAGEWNGKLLLRRRQAARFTALKPTGTAEFQIRDGYLEVPRADHPVLARLRMKLSLAGAGWKFLYKIPEVLLVGFCESGRFGAMRIVPDVLGNLLPLSALPFDRHGLRSLLSEGVVQDPLRGILIGGTGARHYSDSIEVEFFELPDVKLGRAAPPWPDPGTLRLRGLTGHWRVESINGVDAAWRRDVIPVKAPEGIVAVQGWAVDELAGGCAAGVIVEVDGRPIPAVYGIARPDVSASGPGARCSESGFEWGAPAGLLGKGLHGLTIKIISADRKSYLEADHKMRFHLE